MLYQKKAFTIDFYPHYFSNFFKRIYGLLGRMYVFLASEVDFELCVLFVALSQHLEIPSCTDR